MILNFEILNKIFSYYSNYVNNSCHNNSIGNSATKYTTISNSHI